MIKWKDYVLRQDIEAIIQDTAIDWTKFAASTVLVTGATGLIGKQIVMSLLLADEKWNLGIKVVAAVHNHNKAEKVFSDVGSKENLMFLEWDMDNKIKFFEKIDYIIHGASITDSKSFVTKPVEVIQTSIGGCKNVLELSKEKGIKAGVFLSSMEVYGISNKTYLNETDYGYLDHTNVRSSYSESKQLCECLCVSYWEEYNVPFKIARLTQTFGPGVRKDDNRVFAQFARSILEKKDIILFSKGETTRNYCYTADAVRAILLLLLKGENGQAYNVANEETEISILDMARMLVREYSNGVSEVKIQLEDVSKHGFNPVSRTCIQCGKLRELGWEAKIGLREAYGRMMESMLL